MEKIGLGRESRKARLGRSLYERGDGGLQHVGLGPAISGPSFTLGGPRAAHIAYNAEGRGEEFRGPITRFFFFWADHGAERRPAPTRETVAI